MPVDLPEPVDRRFPAVGTDHDVKRGGEKPRWGRLGNRVAPGRLPYQI
jgi:hypothetical protein